MQSVYTTMGDYVHVREQVLASRGQVLSAIV